jgi:hypothetical protein
MIQAVGFVWIEVAVNAYRLVVEHIVFCRGGMERLLIDLDLVVSIHMVNMIGWALIHQHPAFVNQP